MWTRLLTGVSAGSARLRDAVGSALRSSSIHASSALTPLSALRPTPAAISSATGEDAGLGGCAFFLCDLGSCTATRLPDPGRRGTLRPGNVGLLSYPSHAVVVGLLLPGPGPGPGAGTGTRLLYFSSRTNRWSEIEDVSGSGFVPGERPWGAHGVVATGTCTLVWIDLSLGFMSCDLGMAGGPELRFTPLPSGHELPCGTAGLERRRCAGVSAGLLRYAEIADNSINVWTLVEDGVWRWDCGMSLEAVWADTAYRGAGLPQGVMHAMGFVHPEEHYVVYVLLRSWLVGVDARAGKVLVCHFFDMRQPPAALHSSRFVCPWRVPASVLGVHRDENEMMGCATADIMEAAMSRRITSAQQEAFP